MTIQPNRYNDPALGQAFANIASLFAPPSPQDMAAAADAQAKKAQAERLSWLWANPMDPTFDRRNVVAGNYAPTQSYYAVDQGNATTLAANAADNARALEAARIAAAPSVVDQATAAQIKAETDRLSWLFANSDDPTASARSALIGAQTFGQTPLGFGMADATDRRGQDITAQTAIATNTADNTTAVAMNDADNRASIAQQYMTPLAQGATQPGLPASVASQFGVPAMPRAMGAPVPLSETQQKAAERQLLRDNGQLSDTMLLDAILGEQAPVKVATPDGPVFSTPGQAARTGAPAYVDQGSLPKPENGTALLSDGTQVPAIQDVTTGRWKHAQTGAELPANIRIVKMPAPTGSNDELGLGKPAQNSIDQQLLDVTIAQDTAVKLRDLIARSPAAQGAVGWLRGTAQNVVQMGGEVGQYFGGQIKEVTDAIASGAADASLAGSFDPNIPAIEMMANLLAFQYAKTTTGERLSNEMLRAARTALGLEGLTANQESSLARIDTAIKQMESQRAILLDARRRGIDALGQPAPAAPPPAAVTPLDLAPSDLEYLGVQP